jgi:hypothetical protein
VGVDLIATTQQFTDGNLSDEEFQTMLGLLRRFADHEMDQFALWRFNNAEWGTTVFVSVGLQPVGASAEAYTEVTIDGT